MFNQSLASIFGLLFGDHLTNMGHGTVGAALVMNMNCVILNFTGELFGSAARLMHHTRDDKKVHVAVCVTVRLLIGHMCMIT